MDKEWLVGGDFCNGWTRAVIFLVCVNFFLRAVFLVTASENEIFSDVS